MKDHENPKQGKLCPGIDSLVFSLKAARYTETLRLYQTHATQMIYMYI